MRAASPSWPARPACPSDKFELRLGLLRTAQAEWAATPRTSPAARALIAYSRGVNDYLAQARRTGDWPSLFGLTGVYPPPWTPIDSLVLQGVLTQELDYTTTPLDYAILERTLGPAPHHGLVPHTRARPRHPLRPRPLQVPRPRPHRPPSGPGADRGNPTTASTAVGSRQGHRRRQTAAAAKGPVPGPAARVASPPEPSSSRASGTTAVTTADDRQRAEAPVSGPGPSSSRIPARVATAAAAMLAQANALPPA